MIRGDHLKTSHSSVKGRMGLLVTWHLFSGPCMQATLIWNLQPGRKQQYGIGYEPRTRGGVRPPAEPVAYNSALLDSNRCQILHDITRCPSSISQWRSTFNSDIPLSTPPATGIWTCTQHWVADMPRLRQVSNSVAELPSQSGSKHELLRAAL